MKKLFLTRFREKEIVGIKIDNSIKAQEISSCPIILHQFLGNPLEKYISSNLGIFFFKREAKSNSYSMILQRNSLLLPYHYYNKILNIKIRKKKAFYRINTFPRWTQYISNQYRPFYRLQSHVFEMHRISNSHARYQTDRYAANRIEYVN